METTSDTTATEAAFKGELAESKPLPAGEPGRDGESITIVDGQIVEPAKVADDRPQSIDAADLLRLENWALKIEKLQRAVADAQREIEMLSELQRALCVKYQLDQQRDRVQTDGKIVRAS